MRNALLWLLLMCAAPAVAQRAPRPTMLDAGQQFQLAKYTYRTNTRGAVVLANYAAVGMLTGFGFGFNTDLPLGVQYTWRTIGYWNVVNFGLAGIGYASNQRKLRKLTRGGLAGASGLTINSKSQNLYALNVGLDISYTLVGGYLLRRSRTYLGEERARQEGIAIGIITQGGALAIFDTLWYVFQRRNVRLVQRVNIEPLGMGLLLRF